MLAHSIAFVEADTRHVYLDDSHCGADERHAGLTSATSSQASAMLSHVIGCVGADSRHMSADFGHGDADETSDGSAVGHVGQNEMASAAANVMHADVAQLDRRPHSAHRRCHCRRRAHSGSSAIFSQPPPGCCWHMTPLSRCR
jgi:hypothetical protein